MGNGAAEGDDHRVLVYAVKERDAGLSCAVLADAGLAAVACLDAVQLAAEIRAGAGAVVLAEETVLPARAVLVEELGMQPPWSDLPLVVLTTGTSRVEQLLTSLASMTSVTLLERPVRISTLLAAVHAALRVRTRQYQLRDLLQRLAEADRQKDDFLAVLGHELRNPLNAIRFALTMLERVGSTDARSVRYREVIDRQSTNLARMVDDLLDLARIQRGKIVLQCQLTDLNEVAERCVRAAEPAARTQRHLVVLEQAGAPLRVFGDPLRLEQVLSNLLGNAIKYTPSGGHIRVTLAREDGDAVIRVRDTGVGLAPEMLERVFEPFVQIEGSLARSQGGLGLGLPLVRKLVDLHGGSVRASSEGAGRGAEFVLRLAIDAASPTADVASAVAEAATSAGALPLRVLVVEDSDDSREALCELLQLAGHVVEIASDGLEGVRKAMVQYPDVALIDIGLPGLDGFAVARQLRATLSERPPRLIAMTGYGQPQTHDRALDAGFDLFLVKPLSPADVCRALLRR